ncbi:zinc ribbon domain-containing protein [Methylobacterium fujisawaense]|uniref:zinc ribbon domain-containing protein n=1 Tax=Methylobacterium fujisawaense TaxID=107400 RepID=UPI003CC79F47
MPQLHRRSRLRERLGRRYLTGNSSSQDCSSCDARGERTFVCHACGAGLDHDTNAARNVLPRAIAEHGR